MKKKITHKKVAKKLTASTKKKTSKSTKVSAKSRVMGKSGQKSVEKISPVQVHEIATSVNPMLADKDPAHRPGHRRMNVKSNFESASGNKSRPQNDSAMNRMAQSDRISRNNMQRRVILQNGK